ncbi:protein kinase [bacterium]|nr:protein kinase [bacterium]
MAQKWEGKSLVGQRLGQFEVKDEIARGGMGVVYKGYQPSLDRWVAIKTLPIDLAGDRDLVARFQREAEAMVRLNHANIVQIIDRGEDQGQYYFAMEFVEGPSVKDLLKSETIDTDKIFDILLQTCDGLDYAHKKGLVHRDIKPANLLFEEKTGVVKIADFGIAHFSKKDEDMLTLTADNVGMGTMNYMSPEQKVNAKNVDHKSDIYALGVIVYEAFTGKLPMGKFKLPSEVNPKLPRALDAIVQKCLEAEPDERWDSCANLRAALAEAKAATHDKTLKRSMRDAFDRTLTAFGPNRSVGLCILGFVFLLVAGGLLGGGVLFMKSRGAKRRVEEAEKVAREKRDAAVQVGADHEASFMEGEKAGEEAKSHTDSDTKVQDLERAAKNYEEAAAAVRGMRASKAKTLRGEIKTVRDSIKTDDGLVKAAKSSLDDAEKKAQNPDKLDEIAIHRLIAEAKEAISASEKFAESEADLKGKIEKANQDDERVKKAQEQLKAALAARERGDVKAAIEAWNDANKAIAEATKTEPTVIVKRDPENGTSHPTTSDPGPDPASMQLAAKRYAAAESAASAAREEAEDVLKVARSVGLAEGQDKLDAGNAAFKEASPLKPVETEPKLVAAKEAFAAASDAALKALEDRFKADKNAAAGSDKLAPNEYRTAQGLEKTIGDQTKNGDLARHYARISRAYRDAKEKALETGKASVAERQSLAGAARARAVLRVGDKDKSLVPGDESVGRAKNFVNEGKLQNALDELQAAIAAFDRAELRAPSGATSLGRLFVLKQQLDGADAIAACSKGFVVACDKRLKCFTPTFTEAAQETMAEAKVMALCAGDGEDFYAALANKKIVRFTVGNALDAAPALPGRLGQGLPELVTAIAFDRATKRLFVAGPKMNVNVYSVVTGNAASDSVIFDITTPGIYARSIAVLSDGSVVVAGQPKDTLSKPESGWTFSVRRFTPAGDVAETNERVNVACVAATGDGLIGINHAKPGQMLLWSKPSVGDGSTAILKDAAELARPVYALGVSVFGRKAYVLDNPPDQDVTKSSSPRRKAVLVYDLKSE